MLSRATNRALQVQKSSAARRTLATIVDSPLKVATTDRGEPTASLSLVVKAGSRYETVPGVAQVLKNFAFQGTAKRSALRTVRESELYGGVLSASLNREYLTLTADFLKGDEEYFFDVLSGVLTSSNFAPFELAETVGPQVQAETQAALSDPTILALDVAHALAFRNGLGNSLFTPGHVSIDDVKAYASQAFSSGNVAVLGAGISDGELSSLVQSKLGKLPSSSAAKSTPTKYFGGEGRIASPAHGVKPTIFIGYGTSTPSPALSVIAAHLDPTPSVKWSEGTSPIVSAKSDVTVSVVSETYSDGALVGLLIQAAEDSPEAYASLKETAGKAVAALKGVASADEAAVKKAVSKAKFKVASALEGGREASALVFAPQLFSSGSYDVQSALKTLDAIKASDLTKAAKSLLSAKPTIVTVGDLGRAPYADEIGL